MISKNDEISLQYKIQVDFNGDIINFDCKPDQTILEAATEAGITLPSSCCSGVCTTCAAIVLNGILEQPDAMGVKAELKEKGYSLLCVAFPRSDLILKANQEDLLYEEQFGQYQK